MSSRTRKRRRVPQRRIPTVPTARTQRAAPQAPRPRPSRPKRRLIASPHRLYAYGLGAAAVAGAMLIALSQISVHRPDSSAPSGGGPGKPASSLLAGIPQHGNELGPPNAPVVLVEYSDFQCPFCARFAADVLPVIVRDYVRTGTVKLVYRGLAFLGPGSVTALATATAAGSENRMWNVAELLYRYQGPENAWVTDDLLRSITTEAGADADRVFAERDSKTVSATMVRWAHQATADGVQGTPTFLVGRRGEPLEPLALQMMSLSEFRAALDQALGR